MAHGWLKSERSFQCLLCSKLIVSDDSTISDSHRHSSHESTNPDLSAACSSRSEYKAATPAVFLLGQPPTLSGLLCFFLFFFYLGPRYPIVL